MKALNLYLTMDCYDVASLLVSEKILHVTVNFNIDLSFIIVAAVLLLMSYVFRYGEELQLMSDETL